MIEWSLPWICRDSCPCISGAFESLVRSSSISKDWNQILSAWMHNTPPGRRAFETSSKNWDSKSSWSGPGTIYMTLISIYLTIYEWTTFVKIQKQHIEEKRHTYWAEGIHYYCIIGFSWNRIQKKSSC